MFSYCSFFIANLLTSIVTFGSALPADPDPNRIPPLPDFDNLADLDAAETTDIAIGTVQTLADLDLPILSTEDTITLTRLSKPSYLSSSVHLLRRTIRATTPGGSLLLKATGSSFLAPITIGAQNFNVIVDTGSSDTWVARSDFTCVDVVTNQTKPSNKCYFNATYDTTKDTQSSSGTNGNKFKRIDNTHFNVTYGDGEYLTGIFGKVDVSLANIKVPNQQVALATVAAWGGDGLSSGILGLAFPALTGAYPGNDPRGDRYCRAGQTPSRASGSFNQVEYPPLLTNAFQRNLTQAMFSLALSRDESQSGKGGYLGVGGMPDVKIVGVQDNAAFASVPLRTLRGDDQFRYYLINVDGVVVLPVGSQVPKEKRASSATRITGEEGEIHEGEEGYVSNMARRNEVAAGTTTTATTSKTSATASKTTPSTLPDSTNAAFVIDSGTTLSFLPPTLVRTYLRKFSPPGTYDPTYGFWFVDCNARVPPLGITLAGHTFWYNERDLIKRFDRQRCVSGVQESVSGINILGDTWLDSVLVVFDLRNTPGSVRVAARREYVS